MSSSRWNLSFKSKGHQISYAMDQKSFRISNLRIDNAAYISSLHGNHGSYGNVEIFTGPNNVSIAAKTPKAPVDYAENHEEKYKKEIRLLEKAYPGEGLYAIDVRDVAAPTEEHDGLFIYAMFMPCFPEMNLDKAMMQASSEQLIIAYLLATLMELQRLHVIDGNQHGIIHNDVKGNNIRIDKNCKVHYVDFYHSTETKTNDTLTLKSTKADNIDLHYAPELRGEARGSHKPSTYSDTYSVGRMIQLFQQQAIKYFESAEDKAVFIPQTRFYPSFLLSFYEKALNGDRYQRPTLPSLIAQLESISKQPYQPKIDYIFSEKNFPDLQLKIEGKYYSPTSEVIGHTQDRIQRFDTPLGSIRVKFHKNETPKVKILFEENDVDAMAYAASLYPEENEDLNRVHHLANHPARPTECPYSYFYVTRYHKGKSFDLIKTEFGAYSELHQVRILLAILSALQKIHDEGYLIGNIRNAALIIDSPSEDDIPTVRFNNLDWAYRRDAPYAKTTNCAEATHWHPHRRSLRLLAPHQHQDYFALPVLFNGNFISIIKNKEAKETIHDLCKTASPTKSYSLVRDLKIVIASLEDALKPLTTKDPVINEAKSPSI